MLNSRNLVLFCYAALFSSNAFALPEGFNYEEELVPDYTLPDLLILENGERVTDTETWNSKRRPEIIGLFETHVYGRTPGHGINVHFAAEEVGYAFDETALRRQVKIHFSNAKGELTADLLVYLPVDSAKAVPVFIGLNFAGNHTISDDPEVWISRAWLRNQQDGSVVDHRATEKGRGKASKRWNVREILARGYGLATLCCGDLDPDYDDRFQNGLHSLFDEGQRRERGTDQWGTIAAWALGLSTAMDYFESDEQIDHRQVAVVGHSRLGKTALWAGARDQRFAMVISNGSGCGGAALSRRRFGETVGRINTKFPHWFCKDFHRFNDSEAELPVDQHMLLALIAPRPLYVASGKEDLWADPAGEFLSLTYASEIYDLFGKEAIGKEEIPSVNSPILRDVGYHVRQGRHDITPYDWKQFLDFADLHFASD